jgi:hypothetical protein
VLAALALEPIAALDWPRSMQSRGKETPRRRGRTSVIALALGYSSKLVI